MVLHVDVIVLILAFFISLLNLNQKADYGFLRIFPFFLLFSVIVEILAAWLKSKHQSNTLLYNLYSVMEFSFYIYFFSIILEKEYVKKRIRLSMVAFILISVVNIFFIQGPKTFHTYTYTIGSLLLDTLGIFYFLQLFNSEKKIKVIREPAFWITTGLIFFYTTSMSFLGVINYVSTLPKNVILSLINLLVFSNVLLYILFIIAFICQINFRKYTSNTLGS